MNIDFGSYLQNLGNWLLTSGLQILLIVVLSLIALRILEGVTHRKCWAWISLPTRP